MVKSPYIETRFTLEELHSLKDAKWIKSELVHTNVETTSPTFNTPGDNGVQYYRKGEKLCKVRYFQADLMDLDKPDFWDLYEDLEMFFYDVPDNLITG